MSARPRRSWWLAALSGALVVVATVVIAVIGSQSFSAAPTLATQRYGDAELLEQLEPQLEGVRNQIAVAYVTAERTRTAGFGADGSTRFEIASLTKTITGALLADSIERGEVTAQTTLGELLDLAGSPVASVSLQELATYRSGLSEWGVYDEDAVEPSWLQRLLGEYGLPQHDIDLAELLSRARADPLRSRGTFSYSNIGFALLGHALATAAGTDYETLFRTRFVNALGLSATRLGSDGDRNRPRGYDTEGGRVKPWNLGAYAPSGGALSTIDDVAVYARLLLRDDTPARVALTPVFSDPDGSGTGYGWYLRSVEGRQVAWKTGLTGGFSSVLLVDTQRQVAVAVLSNTATPVEDLAWALLEAGE